MDPDPAPSALAQAFDGASTAFAIFDRRAQRVWANRAYRAAVDGPAGAAIAGPLDEVVRRTLAEGRAAATSVSARDDGTTFEIEARPVADPSGGPTLALVEVRDVTERLSEQRRARLFYESYLSSTNAIEITDRHGILVDVNPAFERIYGYRRSECVGRKPNLVRSRATPAEVYADLWAALLDPARGFWSGEIVNRDRWGRERPVFLTITAIQNDRGETTHYLGVAVDLAERREWERRTAHGDKLASLGQLAAGVAHEINTPLSTVLLVTESLRRRTDDPAARARLDTIARQVEVAAVIVRGLLDFAARREPKIAPVDLVATARDAVAFVRGKESSDVEIVEEYPAAGLVVEGDRGEIMQVLTNLLKNAYEAMQGRGRIAVTVRTGDAGAELEVADSGPGIPAEVLPHLFEPFFTTKPEGEGTGLGLAICHGIMQSMHGRITARNGPGGGAVFRLLFPLPPSLGNGSSG